MDLASETNQHAETSKPQQRRPVWGERAAFFSLRTCEQQELGQVSQVVEGEGALAEHVDVCSAPPLSQSLGLRVGVPWRGEVLLLKIFRVWDCLQTWGCNDNCGQWKALGLEGC